VARGGGRDGGGAPAVSGGGVNHLPFFLPFQSQGQTSLWLTRSTRARMRRRYPLAFSTMICIKCVDVKSHRLLQPADIPVHDAECRASALSRC
jgi:hypothetical protein